MVSGRKQLLKLAFDNARKRKYSGRRNNAGDNDKHFGRYLRSMPRGSRLVPPWRRQDDLRRQAQRTLSCRTRREVLVASEESMTTTNVVGSHIDIAVTADTGVGASNVGGE